MLRDNGTLHELDLSGNQIGDAGAQVLGDALKDNRCLRELSLSGNQIDNAGAKALGEALKNNMALRRLNLQKQSDWPCWYGGPRISEERH